MYRRTAVGSLVGVLVGGIVGAVCGYFLVLQPAITTAARSTYFSAIAQARLSALELQLARDGETERLIATLEGRLDGYLIDAANLEEANAAYRDREAEEQLVSVRQYRAKHPSPQKSKGIQDKIARTLGQTVNNKGQTAINP